MGRVEARRLAREDAAWQAATGTSPYRHGVDYPVEYYDEWAKHYIALRYRTGRRYRALRKMGLVV